MRGEQAGLIAGIRNNKIFLHNMDGDKQSHGVCTPFHL